LIPNKLIAVAVVLIVVIMLILARPGDFTLNHSYIVTNEPSNKKEGSGSVAENYAAAGNNAAAAGNNTAGNAVANAAAAAAAAMGFESSSVEASNNLNSVFATIGDAVDGLDLSENNIDKIGDTLENIDWGNILIKSLGNLQRYSENNDVSGTNNSKLNNSSASVGNGSPSTEKFAIKVSFMATDSGSVQFSDGTSFFDGIYYLTTEGSNSDYSDWVWTHPNGNVFKQVGGYWFVNDSNGEKRWRIGKDESLSDVLNANETELRGDYINGGTQTSLDTYFKLEKVSNDTFAIKVSFDSTTSGSDQFENGMSFFDGTYYLTKEGTNADYSDWIWTHGNGNYLNHIDNYWFISDSNDTQRWRAAGRKIASGYSLVDMLNNDTTKFRGDFIDGDTQANTYFNLEKA
jgi:hypothetical protein